jgi:Ca-activated chloride channel family protein
MRRRWVAVLIFSALVASACSGGDDGDGDDAGGVASGFGDPGNCTVVDLAVSSEKIDLMSELAKTFNDSDAAKTDDGCIFARPQSKASGGATDLLATEWNEDADGPRPVIWSPASSAWGAILNQRLEEDGAAPMVGEANSFMQTPLVIAMPKPMADALGYPATPIGYGDILALSQNPEGWAAYGHPEWGPFRLGKTNPNFSTSGLSALIAQNYAATGKTADLSAEDLNAQATVDYNKQIESSVVHYGDITMTFLNNWFRTDKAGTSLTYASAVAVEEKSVIDYNRGNPDGIVSAGERPKEPRVPLVAIYPKEGTLFSDNPLIILDAEWVSDAERKAAEIFEAYIREPGNQKKVLEFGFRPGNPDVAIDDPIVAANGVDPNQPQTLLDVPEPTVLTGLLDRWADQRKGARVMIVLDVSGSMGEGVSGSDETRLDLAKRATIDALDQFKDDDEVGLRIFSTNLDGNGATFQDLIPIGPIAGNKEGLRREIDKQIPREGTPLYEVTKASFEEVLDGYDPSRINAVLLLSDGQNDDEDPDDDEDDRNELIELLKDSTQGETAKPIRIFPISYSADADDAVLRNIAEATNSAVYSANDPKTIDKVFTAVVSNF